MASKQLQNSLYAPDGSKYSTLTDGAGNLIYTPTFAMPKFIAGQAARAAGTRNSRIFCLGHSGTAGQGAGNNGQYSNAAAFGWTTVLSTLVPQGSWQSSFGDGNVGNSGAGANIDAYDNRIVHGGWGFLRTNTLAGPGCAFFTATGAETFAFTPTTQVDTFEFYAAAGTGGTPTINVNVDGGSNTLVTLSGSARILKTTVSTTLGNHTFNVLWAGGSTFWNGIIAYNSAVKETTVLRAGWCAALTSDLIANTSYSGALAFMPFWQPDLVIIQAEGNDIIQGTSVSAFATNTQTIITAAKNAGADVMLVIDVPLENLDATRIPYDNVYIALGYSNKINVINQYQNFGSSWTVANNNGYMFDQYHLNKTGYPIAAEFINIPLLANP